MTDHARHQDRAGCELGLFPDFDGSRLGRPCERPSIQKFKVCEAGLALVSLAAPAGPWQPSGHDDFIKSVSRLPVPARGHRARGLALSLLQPEPARC